MIAPYWSRRHPRVEAALVLIASAVLVAIVALLASAIADAFVVDAYKRAGCYSALVLGLIVVAMVCADRYMQWLERMGDERFAGAVLRYVDRTTERALREQGRDHG